MNASPSTKLVSRPGNYTDGAATPSLADCECHQGRTLIPEVSDTKMRAELLRPARNEGGGACVRVCLSSTSHGCLFGLRSGGGLIILLKEATRGSGDAPTSSTSSFHPYCRSQHMTFEDKTVFSSSHIPAHTMKRSWPLLPSSVGGHADGVSQCSKPATLPAGGCSKGNKEC